MPLSNPSTALYTLGRGILSIGEWVGTTPPSAGAYADVGNCPSFDVEVTEETLDHFSSRAGTKTKDKQVTLETGYTATFELDEISVNNLKMYLRGTLTGAASHVIRAAQALDKEHALKFDSANAAGPDEVWEFWRCRLTPNGAFSLISDEWSTLSFSAEGLSDVVGNPTSPYFSVTFATTTTTSTTASTTSSTVSTTTTSP